MLNTFVVQILEGPVEGEIDNFFMQEALYVFNEATGAQEPYETKTISFNEENKGWVSFKSFVPENGISLSNKYFTILDGKLYEHYAASQNDGYNTFYNEFTPSHITTVFNDEPSIVKTFHTLNYEGSLSRRYYDNTIQSIGNSTYVITNDWEDGGMDIGTDGWYADIIKNNSGEVHGQVAQILEFKKKEGKWFNNITGAVIDVTNALVPHFFNLDNFSAQGLGVVLSSQNVASGSSGSSGASGSAGSGNTGSGSSSSSSPY